ncbi:TPA: hypothetical protein ACH3X2_011354 [Trebouxia sp. C0005]
MKDHQEMKHLLFAVTGIMDTTTALLTHTTIILKGQGVTTVDLLTHATTTLLDQGTMDVARVTTGADHPTTDMAATLHHVITATHTMDKGHHPTSECCLGTGVRQMQFATSKKTEKQSTG